MTRIAGLVLGGGKSRRMGQAKAGLKIGPISLLENTLRILQEAGCQPLAVALAAGQELPAFSTDISFDICIDPIPDQGPLAGIASGLRHLESRADYCCVLPCDLPKVSARVVRALIGQACVEKAGPVCLIQGTRPNPLIGVYPCSWHQKAAKLLENSRFRADGLLMDCPELRFYADNSDEGCWDDCDTPEAWEAMRQKGPGGRG